jgi:hypothetical protein
MVASRLRRAGGAEKMFPDVGAIQSAELPEQFTGSFIAHRGQHDLQMDHQIPGLAPFNRCGDAMPWNPQLPSRRCAGRNSKLERSLERRHLDTRAQTGLMHGHGQCQMQIPSVADEVRMRCDANGQVQIAGGPTPRSRVAPTRNRQAGPLLNAGRDFNRNNLTARLDAGAATQTARLHVKTARALAIVARPREHHVAARPSSRPLAATGWTRRRSRPRHPPIASARPASLLPRYRYWKAAAAQGIPE